MFAGFVTVGSKNCLIFLIRRIYKKKSSKWMSVLH